MARELSLVWGIETFQDARLTTLFREQKYEALIKLLCGQKVLDRRDIVILVQTMHASSTLIVTDVGEVMRGADEALPGARDV